MKRIEADQDRRITIAGVPGPVRRPVDIDRTRTEFVNLRSLRIYRFDSGSTIDGHAEEDEVLVVVMAGSIEFTVSGDNSGAESHRFTLSAAHASPTGSGPQPNGGWPCAAYLPPQSAYRLIASHDAEVAYARATPASGPPAAVFTPQGSRDAAGITVLLEEKTYPRRLRLQLLRVTAGDDGVSFPPVNESEAFCEALVHIRTVPPKGSASMSSLAGEPLPLESWDTIAIAPGDRPRLRIAAGCTALVLVVSAI